MLAFLQSVGGFIFIFGIVVLVHEAGHFFAAKLTGVYAPRFSVGFGPGPKKRWGETQYQIGIIPLGGYVRMASRDDEATAFLEGGSETSAAESAQAGAALPRDWDPEAMIPFGPKPVPEHRWFESKSLPQRLFILVAGVCMNALLTLVVLFGLLLSEGPPNAGPNVVGTIVEFPATSGLVSALQPGDTIRSVQNTPVRDWEDVVRAIITLPGDSMTFVTSRGTIVVASGPPKDPRRDTIAGAMIPMAPPIIGTVVSGRPAAVAGLQKGDSIVSIDGRAVNSFSDLRVIVGAAADSELVFSVLRNGRPLDIPVRPARTALVDPTTGDSSWVGQIGVEVARERVGVGTAFVMAAQGTAEMAGTIVTILGDLVKRDVAFNQLGGPIEIARVSGEAAQEGMTALLGLLAALSINLAVLNLLPIPVLDGGQILIVIAEGIKGSPFSPKARQVILGTGVALVLLLMLAVSYNDVVRLFGS